jgi:hypothetical protein
VINLSHFFAQPTSPGEETGKSESHEVVDGHQGRDRKKKRPNEKWNVKKINPSRSDDAPEEKYRTQRKVPEGEIDGLNSRNT